MVLQLDPRVGDVCNDCLETVSSASITDKSRKLQNRELFSELVEDAQLAEGRGATQDQLDAGHGVANIEVAARLPALSIDGERKAHRSLHAESVERSTPDGVVVEPRLQLPVQSHLWRIPAVYHSLVEVGRAQAPDSAGEMDVVAVVHLAEVVEAAWELRIEDPVLATVVADVEVALFDVYVARSILAHRPQLDQVTFRDDLGHCEQEIEVADDVILLGHRGVLPINHGERSAPLLGEMNDSVRPVPPEQVHQGLAIANIKSLPLDGPSSHLFPLAYPTWHGSDSGQAMRASLPVPFASTEVVDSHHFMTAAGEMEAHRPPQIPIRT